MRRSPQKKGQPEADFRMALGTLLFKERYYSSDDKTVVHITMNPYFQYFIGLEAFTQRTPFDASMLTRFRKRITPLMLAEVNDIIIGRPRVKVDDDDSDGSDGNGTSDEDDGTLILDANCAPQNIRFPTDAQLLNEARLNAEAIIDILQEHGLTGDGPKPRTYRREAKNDTTAFQRAGRRRRRTFGKAIRQQLGYLWRDLTIIGRIAAEHPDYLEHLPQQLRERLLVIRTLYSQQQDLFETNTRRTDDRIVSLSQPWVRPIKRGKQNADTEFGAKVEMSDTNGFLRIEHLGWDAFNESTTLKGSAKSYRRAYGHYPKRILADTIFRSREKLRFCKEHDIHLNGPRLGKPSPDPLVRKQELREEWIDSGERGDIDRRFGINKRCYSLGCITAKLKHKAK